MRKRVAVVLSGCGYLDGSEVHEATFVLLALDFANADVTCFAPDREQRRVVDHCGHNVVPGQTRNILTESARVARGVKPLASARMSDFDALVFPGGYGVVNNLSDFADKGVDCEVDADVDRVILEAFAGKKPICAVCIAPVLLAKVLGPVCHPTLTIGNDPRLVEQVVAMGAKHTPASYTEVVIDQENLLLTSPAYLDARGPSGAWCSVYLSIEKTMNMLTSTDKPQQADVEA